MWYTGCGRSIQTDDVHGEGKSWKTYRYMASSIMKRVYSRAATGE